MLRSFVFDLREGAFISFSDGKDLHIPDQINGSTVFPTDVIDERQILGSGNNENGVTEPFISSYTPDTVFNPQPIYISDVPEPETYMMLLGGLALIDWITCRRKISVH